MHGLNSGWTRHVLGQGLGTIYKLIKSMKKCNNPYFTRKNKCMKNRNGCGMSSLPRNMGCYICGMVNPPITMKLKDCQSPNWLFKRCNAIYIGYNIILLELEHGQVSAVVVYGLAPTRHLGICNHHHDVCRSVDVGGVKWLKFCKQNFCIFTQIKLKFVPLYPINDKSILVRVIVLAAE